MASPPPEHVADFYHSIVQRDELAAVFGGDAVILVQGVVTRRPPLHTLHTRCELLAVNISPFLSAYVFPHCGNEPQGCEVMLKGMSGSKSGLAF